MVREHAREGGAEAEFPMPTCSLMIGAPPPAAYLVESQDMLGGLAFYPSLGYNLLRNYIQPQKWCWFNRIDENLIVGALPFKSMRDELVNKENVGGVVCCVEDYELNLAYNAMTKEDWQAAGVAVYDIPMRDFFGSAGRAEIDSAVHFMEGIAAKRKSVYVHCKAGRTRSATVAVCYLVKKHDWLPNVAMEFLKSKRPQTILRNAHWRTANEYRRFLDHHKANDQRSGSL